ncbi:hypothetical protein O0I10_010345 [Lichtheimia ornata]|uniref:CMP/dCMP-type deaminase domain-containing protein n=1 Tax=Lichtheimia ornata TaxID=688661 RepID=A0AAD7UUW6_9FUNG|nr:uncharacterized protein O0I10_010345 [Lichtheimia ornata]KAJ8654009.1 hypothetical protein O0I10_010345 [Lichtheimia ornata]
MSTPSHDEMIKHLRITIDIAARGRSMGHHPFGSTLVSPEGEILLQQCNFGPVFHAESELARVAATNFSPEYLSKCVLYTSVEPCAMCTGTCYWANIGTLAFGLPGSKLAELTDAAGSKENPTLKLTTREILATGSRDIKVFGPFPELEEEIVKDHKGFWETH